MPINFENFTYYPAIRTRPAEVFGYMNLADSVKDKLLPLITLGSWRNQDGVTESMEQARKAIGDRPLILDVTSEVPHQNNALRKFFDPSDNFGAWRAFIQENSSVIPVVQITPNSKNQQIIRQTREFENSGLGKVAFRITDFRTQVDKVTTALSAMDSPSNALVIIDVGYIRETMAASIAACAQTINQVREDIEDAIITVISSSFPSSVTPFLDPNSAGKRGILSILERELHEEIGGKGVVIYGDHSSIHSRVYTTSGGRYTPRIDYPLYDAWVFERRPETNSQGYVNAASSLLQSYPEILEDESWGAEMIRRASKGNIEGMKTPSSWIAARVNSHITRQLALSSESVDEDEEDFDF